MYPLNAGDQNRATKPNYKMKDLSFSLPLYSKITMVNDLFDFEGRTFRH